MRKNLVFLGAVALLLGACAQLARLPAQEAPTADGVAAAAVPVRSLVINEFVANHTGTDTHEFIEVFGMPDTDYSVYSLLQIEGDGDGAGVIDSVHAVGTTNATGHWSTGFLDNALENGTMSLLLVEGFTGAVSDDLDTDNDGTLDVTPWTALVDGVAVNDGGASDLTYASTVLDAFFDDQPFTPGGASRFPDGGDTWVRNDFDGAGLPGFTGTHTVGEALNTPGEPNALVEEEVVDESCAATFTPIYEIQGNGAATPLAGQTVTTQGVVVGDFEGPSPTLRGFYLQDLVGDGDPATSDGIFVFNEDRDSVSAGDVVRVEGRVSEFRGMTQISAAAIVACGTGSVEPTPIMLPVTSLSDFERYEGMLVTFPQELVISEYFNFDRFGEIVLALPPAGLDRPFQPTSYAAPGPAAAAVAAANALARITLDDARTSQNPTPAIHPNGELFTLDNRFRGGDLVTGAVGILDYRFNLYRLQPVGPVPYAAANPRTPTPDDVGGDVQVAAFNVLNYFSTLDTGAPICGPLGNQGCRGADNAEEFDRQRSKIIAALAIIDADVVGLIEIENGGDALVDLVSGLNAMVGAGTYAAIETGPIGPDAIRVALIYQPGGVTPIGGYAVLDTPDFLDPLGAGEAKNRPALAQTFASVGDGGAVTVVVNHLKSKGSPCAGDSDPDQGNCNVTRTLAAERLLEWIATDPTGAQDPDYLFIGDFNAYDEEDPIATLAAGGLTDLLEAYQGEFVYTYLFGAQFGHLDYALSTPTLTTQVTGATAWAINADEPDILDYDTSFKEPAEAALFAPDPYRSSDHDPVIVGLDLNAAPVCSGASASVTSLWPANHRLVAASVLGVTDPEGDPLQIVIDAIYQDEPVNADGDGNTMPDAVIGSGNAFEVRAERSGEGDGRVYHVLFTALDATGSCSGEVLIGVPLNQRRNGVAIDGGPLYDSTVP